MRSAVWLGVLSIAMVGGLAAADPPAKKPVRQIKLPKGVKVPPDIQAIINKQNSGGTLTMEDIQKLQAWAAGVANNMPVNGPMNPQDPSKPANPDEKPGITVPARIDLSAHYTRKSGGTLDTVTISESTNLDLLAKINGTDDYASNVLDPNANVSTFLFQSASPNGGGHYRFHQEGSGTVDFDADMSSVGAGLMLVTMGGDTLGIIPGQMNGEVDGRYHNVASDGKATDHAYQGQMRESLLDLLFPYEAHTTKDKSKPNPKPRAQISYKQIVDAIQSGKPTPIKVTEHFEWNDHGEQVVGNVDVTITLRPAPGKLEPRLVALDDWSSWLPEGPTEKKEHGNTFGLRVEVFDGETPSTKKPEKVVYKLKHVTSLPGVCTNWPSPQLRPLAGAKEELDLFFPKSNANAKIGKEDKDGQILELDGDYTTDGVTIESRDFGAYGELTVTVTMPGKAPVDITFKDSKQPYATLPRDDNQDKIADSWEKGRKLVPDADDESTGGFKTKGDGFTVMEEYRGFLLAPKRAIVPSGGGLADEQHKRLDPDVRELLVLLEIDQDKLPRVERGIEIFESASQVKVYSLATSMHTAPHEGDNGRPRSIVLNPTPVGSPGAKKSSDTVGVWITSKALQPDDAVARAWPIVDHVDCVAHPTVCIGSPQLTRYVAIGGDAASESTINWELTMIDPDNEVPEDHEYTRTTQKKVDMWLRDVAVTDAQRRAAVASGRLHFADLVVEMAGFAIAHELGHVLGAQHHGVFANDDKQGTQNGADNCPMRYWQELNSYDMVYKKTVPDPDHPGKTKVEEIHKFGGFNVDPSNALEWMDFFTGKWNPLNSGPSGPWTFCEENWPQMKMTR